MIGWVLRSGGTGRRYSGTLTHSLRWEVITIDRGHITEKDRAPTGTAPNGKSVVCHAYGTNSTDTNQYCSESQTLIRELLLTCAVQVIIFLYEDFSRVFLSSQKVKE